MHGYAGVLVGPVMRIVPSWGEEGEAIPGGMRNAKCLLVTGGVGFVMNTEPLEMISSRRRGKPRNELQSGGVEHDCYDPLLL